METMRPAPVPIESPEAGPRRWWRKWWVWLVVAAAVALAVAAVVAIAVDDGTTVTSEETTTTRPSSTTAEPSVTTAPTTTAGDTTTVSPTTTSPSTTGQTTTTGPPAAVPGVVTVQARPGGGSGEIAVRWDATPAATGYRVLRSDSAGGPSTQIADIDVTTGARTSAAEVTTIWSQGHTYGQGALGSPDRSPWFELIEVGGPRERCFQVVAYNAAGQGSPSAPACSTST